jgi:hypothetical protein
MNTRRILGLFLSLDVSLLLLFDIGSPHEPSIQNVCRVSWDPSQGLTDMVRAAIWVGNVCLTGGICATLARVDQVLSFPFVLDHLGDRGRFYESERPDFGVHGRVVTNT